MPTLHYLVPDAETILALEPAELAGVLHTYLVSETSNNGSWNRDSFFKSARRIDGSIDNAWWNLEVGMHKRVSVLLWTFIVSGSVLFGQAQDHDHAAAKFTPRPSNLIDVQWKHGPSDGEIFTVIRNGVPKTSMSPFRKKITERETWDVVNFIRSIGTKSDPHAH